MENVVIIEDVRERFDEIYVSQDPCHYSKRPTIKNDSTTLRQADFFMSNLALTYMMTDKDGDNYYWTTQEEYDRVDELYEDLYSALINLEELYYDLLEEGLK